MSTTFDPAEESNYIALEEAVHVNGKYALAQREAPPSQAAGRTSFWRSSAPGGLKKKKLPPHEAWLAYWKGREARPAFQETIGGDLHPLRWSLPSAALSSPTERLLDLLSDAVKAKGAENFAKSKRNKQLQSAIGDWISAVTPASPDVELGIGSVAAAHLLYHTGGVLAPELGWKLIDALFDLARQAERWAPEKSDDALLAQQLLGGEFPFTLSQLFDEMKPLHALREAASDALSEGLVELHNGEGLPSGVHLAPMRSLLASWTRCLAIARDESPFSENALRQYRGLVRQALRWTAPNGAELLKPASNAWQPELLNAALQLGGKKQDVAAARQLLGDDFVSDELRGSKKKRPDAPYQCEWSELALMRAGWSPKHGIVAVNYSDGPVQLDVWAEGRRLLAGPWLTESKVDGVTVDAAEPWEQTCSFSDRDVDYLELTQLCSDGVRIDRQILFARRDQFVYLCDHFYGGRTGALEHAWQLPLGSAILFCGEGETRDALMVDGAPLARVMPLALPEWRVDPRVGELSYAAGVLRLSQRVVGDSVACPLFIDLNSKRAQLPSTWRQLTVAEALEIKSTDVAVSYRVQAGDDQWVFYRSQGRRGNRTFMGQNTSSECYIARFLAPGGEVEELLEIDG
jgi:hypothetical protein